MMKHFTRKILPFVCFILLFLTIRYPLQKLLSPYHESTAIVEGFYALEKDSLDAVFLGSSHMYYTVNAQMLTEEYGIPSYDFGASGQMLDMTCSFFREMLKTQSPRVVMVEMLKSVSPKSEANENAPAWTFVPMPMSWNKVRTVYDYFDGDLKKTMQYTFAPLMQWHNRWENLTREDWAHLFKLDRTHPSRGYQYTDVVRPHDSILYDQEAAGECALPEENKELLRQMAALAERENIRLIFFKSPSPIWTREQSEAVTAFMAEEGLEYLDLHEYLNELGIDYRTDFSDDSHLNTSSAEKVTRFLAGYLQD